MKKIFNFLKTLLYGILPAISGGLITLAIIYTINNIKSINTGSGWSVVWCFTIAIIELILAICLLYELGVIHLNSNKWIAHKREETTDNIDSISADCETFDEATNSSPDKTSNNKRKKS